MVYNACQCIMYIYIYIHMYVIDVQRRGRLYLQILSHLSGAHASTWLLPLCMSEDDSDVLEWEVGGVRLEASSRCLVSRRPIAGLRFTDLCVRNRIRIREFKQHHFNSIPRTSHGDPSDDCAGDCRSPECWPWATRPCERQALIWI